MSLPIYLASMSLSAVVFCYFSLVLKFMFLKWWPKFHTTCNLEMFYVVNCTLLLVKALMCQAAKQECHERSWSSPLKKEKLGKNLLMYTAENKRGSDMKMPINYNTVLEENLWACVIIVEQCQRILFSEGQSSTAAQSVCWESVFNFLASLWFWHHVLSVLLLWKHAWC